MSTRIKVPRTITAEWLLQQGACKGELRKFKRMFPNGARLTLANLRRAYRLEMAWFAATILSGRSYSRFRSVRGRMFTTLYTDPGFSWDRYDRESVDLLWAELKRDKVVRS